MQASKWLKVPVLMETAEMRALFSVLEHFDIYLTGRVTKQQEGIISQTDFLNVYEDYIQSLKHNQLTDESLYRSYFSSVFSETADHLYVMAVDGARELTRVIKPVIQLQQHAITYSGYDEHFHSMVFGSECIPWGIQFSYPQLFQDKDGAVKTVIESIEFPNTALFHRLQRWIRHHTIPTPFVVDGKKINVPMRLGKLCLPWINQHPQLVERRIAVAITV